MKIRWTIERAGKEDVSSVVTIIEDGLTIRARAVELVALQITEDLAAMPLEPPE